MHPTPALSNEQIKRHDELSGRAFKLLKGLIILDGLPEIRLGFFGKRKLRKAIRLLESVIELNPANWSSLFAIGKAHQSLGDLDQSLTWFLRAHEVVPDNPSVAKEVGYAAGRLGKHDVAVRVMEPIAKQHPNNAGLQCNLGLSYLLAGNVIAACRVFEHIVVLEPQSDVNKKLLALAQEVASGQRPGPKTEADISRALN